MALKLERPLDPGLLRVIAAVQAGAQAEGVEPLLVGAAARDLLLVHVHGQRVRRATRDVDFAVALESWEAFEQLKQRLVTEQGFASDSRQVQRLVLAASGEGAGTVIDLVPYGPLQVDQHTLLWPPDMDVAMTVAGFAEAFAAAVVVELAAGLQVKVASLPGLAILKLFAWSDRRLRDAKDAIDFCTLLRSYGGAGNFDRLSDPDQGWERFFSLDCDEEKAGAWLLGGDCGVLVNSETAEHLRELWQEPGMQGQLISAMTSGDLGAKGAQQTAGELLSLFVEGFEQAISR